MNGETFGGYNGYGEDVNGNDRERDDLDTEDYGTVENPEYSTLDTYDQEEKEEYTTEDYRDDVKDELEGLYANLDKNPDDEKTLQYIATAKAILERLEQEIRDSKFNRAEIKASSASSKGETYMSMGDPANRGAGETETTSYVDSQGRVWKTPEEAAASDRKD